MGAARTLGALAVCLLVSLTVGQEELFNNPDFEEPFGDDNWWCLECQLDHSTDAYTGQYSGQVTARQASYAGVTQNVLLEPNKKYYFTLRTKIINDQSGTMFQRMDALIAIDYTTGETEYKWLAANPRVRQEYEWQLFAADFEMDDRGIDNARFYIEFQDQSVDYVMDTASLTEIIPNPDWVAEANQRIDQLRREDLTVVLSMTPEYDPQQMEIEVRQTLSDFPWGCAVHANLIVDTDYDSQQYQDHFYNYFSFEWAVMENALKWQEMEPVKGDIDFETPDNAINALLSHGVPVRGHCLFWNIDQWVQDWLLYLTGDDLIAEVDRRIDYMTDHYRRQLVHWDVNNEVLHGDFYERQTGDPNFLEYMLHETKNHDQEPILFLNDYDIVNTGTYASAYVSSAELLQSRGVPVQAMGVQSHFMWGGPDVDRLMKRLDMVASAGLPVWVTELDVVDEDVYGRADGYMDAMRLYFSHPDVHGVLIWGFWDQAHWLEHASLVDGYDWVINEAGYRYEYLVHEEWRTNFDWYPANQDDTYQTRAFQGAYDLTVLYNGSPIQSQSFYVSQGQSETVYVNVG